MSRGGRWPAVVALALVAALAPIPPPAVERWYSTGLYPIVQHVLTRASNVVPFALFDLLWVAAIVVSSVAVYRCIHGDGWRIGMLRLVWIAARAAALAYLVFLAAWGFNYRRVPLVAKVVFVPDRVTRAAAIDLGEANVVTLNTRYAPAHQTPETMASLRAAFEDTVRALGEAPRVVTGRPKATLLAGYFHAVSIAGMTDPFLLETLVASDLLEVERPFVIAHEWAHLAGYADESEANYVAWLTCRRGDAAAQYSGALAVIGYALPKRPLNVALDLGPRIDLYAIRYRYTQTVQPMRIAASATYDKYLKANRVQAGIGSYDLVVQLILGTSYDAQGNPVLKSVPGF